MRYNKLIYPEWDIELHEDSKDNENFKNTENFKF